MNAYEPWSPKLPPTFTCNMTSVLWVWGGIYVKRDNLCCKPDDNLIIYLAVVRGREEQGPDSAINIPA